MYVQYTKLMIQFYTPSLSFLASQRKEEFLYFSNWTRLKIDSLQLNKINYVEFWDVNGKDTCLWITHVFVNQGHKGLYKVWNLDQDDYFQLQYPSVLYPIRFSYDTFLFTPGDYNL